MQVLGSTALPLPADLVGALEAALGAAVSEDRSLAIVGLLSPGLPAMTRETDGIDLRARQALLEAASGVPDGPITSRFPGGTSWRGYRAAVGDGRTAFAILREAVDASPVEGRAEAAVLVLVRAALLAADRRRSDRLEQLLATARRVAESLELDPLLSAIVQDAARLVGADSGDMLLWDRELEKLRVVAVWNFPPEMLGFELDFGEGLSSQAILGRRTLSVEDYATYPHRAKALDHYDFGGVLCSPLMVRGEAIGALNVHARGRSHVFGSDDADLLAGFAGHAAIAIDHARRHANEIRLGKVAAETNRELTRSLTVQGLLVEQVLMDGGPAGIAAVLAEHLGRSAVIQDHLHRVIAGAAPGGGEAWRALLGTDQRHDPFTVTVRIGRDVVGHLLLSSDDALDSIDRALVDIATTGVALEFARLRAAAAVEERLRGEAFGDLLGGTYPSEESVAMRAARLGYDLSEPRDLLAIDPGTRVDASADGASSPHERSRADLDVVRERLALRAPGSVALIHAGVVVVLATQRRGAAGPRELATDLQTTLAASPAREGVTIAIGDVCTRPGDYPEAFRLARNALDLVLRLGRRGTVVSVAELGPYALLLRASSRADLEAYAQARLAPLVEYDRRHHAELVATLRAFLTEDRVQRRAAARLSVHVNTVVYRLRRIEELLGGSLAQPDTVFDLTLALRIVDVLEPPRDPVAQRAEGQPAVNA